MGNNGVELISLPDAADLIGISYQTLLKKKREYGAVEVDAPGAIKHAIPSRFVREHIEIQIENARDRLRQLEEIEQDVTEIWAPSVDGEERLAEMAYLRFEELWTLQEIGERFGVSRERVRQILGNTGPGFKSTRLREKARAMSDKTNEEVAKALGISEQYASALRSGLRVPAKSGYKKLGTDKEEWVAALLEDKGFSCELKQLGHPFDILIDGKCRVDVKFSKTPKSSPSHECVSPTWRFAVRGDRENCDFYVCVTANDDVFVIPSGKVSPNMESLVFVYPTKRPDLAKWQKYYERYDLIENFSANGHNGHK